VPFFPSRDAASYSEALRQFRSDVDLVALQDMNRMVQMSSMNGHAVHGKTAKFEWKAMNTPQFVSPEEKGN